MAYNVSLMSKYYEDLNIGDEFVSPISRTITETDVVNFVSLSGMYEPLFIDEEYAKKTPFGKRIAPGLLTLAISLGLSIRLGLTDKTALGLLGMDRMQWPAPVSMGDTVSCIVKVINKRETSKPDRGIIVYKHTVRNQRGETVLEYERTQLIRRRPKE